MVEEGSVSFAVEEDSCMDEEGWNLNPAFLYTKTIGVLTHEEDKYLVVVLT